MDFQKRRPYRNPKILKAAQDEPCTLLLDGCTGGGADTVAAHSNYGEDGKGGAQKADDCFVAFTCHHCHGVLDGQIKSHYSRAELRDYFHMAMKRTWRRLLDKGVLR